MANLERITTGIKSARAVLLDTLLPHQCPLCHAIVGGDGGLCGGCWAALHFIAPPLCACCGFPFPHAEDAPDALCADCLRRRPVFARARAALVYDDASRPLVLDLKHRDRLDLARVALPLLAGAGSDLLDAADLVLAVPLHWRRRLRRRANQSAELARALAARTGLPFHAGLLVRRKATPSQGGLGRGGRRRNVQGAFAVPERARPVLAGRRILLIDDVFTTGATGEACARSLLAAGARAVDLLTLTRVVRPAA